jgi:hypothetical protein
MLCPKYTRLRQCYEAALRKWGEVLLFSQGTDLHGAAGRLPEHMRQKAYEERDAAKEQMSLHEQNCKSMCTEVAGLSRSAQ